MATINRPLPRAGRDVAIPLPRINGWILASVIVLGIGAVLPVAQNSVATSRGFDSQSLDARQARIRGDLRNLESEVARLTSLDRIERRATDIGMIPSGDDVRYIEVTEPGPAPAKIPAEYLPRVEPVTDDPAPWWQSLHTWVPLP
jgi:hypothetical protein